MSRSQAVELTNSGKMFKNNEQVDHLEIIGFYDISGSFGIC